MYQRDRISFLREAGHVRRCHIVPHFGEYDVARHSWHAAMLLRELYPEASKTLIWYVLEHDVAERWTGDVPATAKMMFEALAIGVKAAEEVLGGELGLMSKDKLTTKEQQWAKAVDMAELHLWCLDQLAMGNTNVEVLMENIQCWVAENRDSIPDPALEVLAWERNGYVRTRDLLWKGRR